MLNYLSMYVKFQLDKEGGYIYGDIVVILLLFVNVELVFV